VARYDTSGKEAGIMPNAVLEIEHEYLSEEARWLFSDPEVREMVCTDKVTESQILCMIEEGCPNIQGY